MQNISPKIVIIMLLTVLTCTLLHAQENDTLSVLNQSELMNSEEILSPLDSTDIPTEFPLLAIDSTVLVSDSIVSDSLKVSGSVGDAITIEVLYDASDSIIFSMDGGTAELYGSAVISYGDIKLEADYIKYEMNKSEVLAYGIPDSTGKVTRKPIFSDGDGSYEAKRLRYNFKTQKGFIEEVITEQEGGFLHSHVTKKQKNGHIHIKDGKYTTCDAEHPHFYIAITKGISMPGDKIISGPAYLVFQDIPLPVGVPFGFFPNSQTKTSGILIPQYGEEERRGFYLRDGGYYFALNEYFDFRITGDIYTNGTWGIRAGSNYNLRYKFNGGVNVQYFNNISGIKDTDSYSISHDYSINWNHSQAREASPNSTFRASVNLSSSSYDQQHTRNINSVLTNTKQSSISYSKSWPNSPFNFSGSLNHSQNSKTNSINMTLPKMALNMGRINPFERKKRVGPKKWYENVQLSYSSLIENRIKTTDTALFTSDVWNDMSNGFRHEIPLSLNIKPFKKIAVLQSMTITPNVSYKGMLYTGYTEKFVSGHTESVVDGETIFTPIIEDTIYKNRLSYAQAYLPRISAGISPKIYGMYQFTGNGRVEAIRHMMTPSASISYTPDMSGIQANYYRDVVDSLNGNTVIQTYSMYEDQIYGTPTFNGAAGSINLSLKNNLEAKVSSRNDTIDEVSKVKLLDNFNLSTNYNLFNKDSLAPSWSTISMNGNTRLFNNKLSLNFRGVMDPFGYDSLRVRTKQTFYAQEGKLVRLTAASISMGITFKSKQDTDKGEGEDDMDEPLSTDPFGNSNDLNTNNNQYNPNADDYYSQYVDFDVPWSLKFDYSFSYKKRTDESSIIQTVRASGDLSLTPKWKIGFNTGYDIFNKQFTTTNVSLYRDLHCWEMRISVVPFGNYKSYNFQINAKSNILSDLKYNKRKSWQDNF